MCDICHSFPCRPQCPNFEDEPLMFCNKCDTGIFAGDSYYEICGEIFCEDCVHGGYRTADREPCYNSGKPVISYGDKWEE
jgi:hypothetical protein